jgi:hypothetical protein
MPISTNPVQLPRPRSRRWRWPIIGLLAGFIVIGIIIGSQLWARRSAQIELDTIIAELDESDPRWRLEHIEADREQIPDDQNSALILKAIKPGLRMSPDFSFKYELFGLTPVVALTPDQAVSLAAELKNNKAVLDKARSLKDYPRGRHAIQYAKEWWHTDLNDQQASRNIADLLDLDVFLLLNNHDMAQAVNSNRALLNSGRSVGDSPLQVSMLIRMSLDSQAVRNIERILAQGEVDLAQLEERQQAFGEELDVPFFSIGMRGERAGVHQLLTTIETGKVSLFIALSRPEFGSPSKTKLTAWEHVDEFFAGSIVRYSHATLLRYETKVVEAAKLPPPARYAKLQEIIAEFKAAAPKNDKQEAAARILFFASSGVVEQQTYTKLSCAVAGLAAERFRLQKQRWPASLEELVNGGYLKKTPKEFFDDKPLRFRRAPDGLVIYSVLSDRAYDGTALDEKPKDNKKPDQKDVAAKRLEFRLWDVDRRRQTPPAK